MPDDSDKLIRMGGDSISRQSVKRSNAKSIVTTWGQNGDALVGMLQAKNGWFAYEGCLLLRPWSNHGSVNGIVEWNIPGLWRDAYDTELSDYLFFSEDVFGEQIALGPGGIVRFDPETGEIEELCASLEEWCELVVADYKMQTGHPVGHAWQQQNGPLQPGQRLVPKIPFVCRGEYTVENLFATADIEGMRLRAKLANHIRDLPDGAEIVFKIVE